MLPMSKDRSKKMKKRLGIIIFFCKKCIDSEFCLAKIDMFLGKNEQGGFLCIERNRLKRMRKNSGTNH